MSFDEIPLVKEVKPREGWMRTEGFNSFSIPIQPHFHDEFPILSAAEFRLLIGYQLWWINAPAFARHEMSCRQAMFGPSAWTAFAEVKETPELIASQIRAALHSSKPKQPAIQIFANPICFEPTAKVLEVASTISDILADIDATIPQQIEDQKTLLRFIEEDRASNPMADETYREDEHRAIKTRIKRLINKMNGHGGSNWITPLNQQITTADSFK